ncbi:MAG TPA: PadR family transcriptional regulator [Acidimicrobiales bacterium]|nr:PadR family transcriptional regulator [Acidimicrobiales bacterium]
MTDLNATQGSLLGFLHEGPKTGWELLQEVEGGLSHFWNVTSSHVYRELRTLEDRGFATAGAPGARAKVAFTITAAGRRAFREWIAVAPGPEQIRFPLLVTLWFGRFLEPDVLDEFLSRARTEHRRRLDLYTTIGPAWDDDPQRQAVIRFGIAYEEAVVAWLASLAPDRPGHAEQT